MHKDEPTNSFTLAIIRNPGAAEPYFRVPIGDWTRQIASKAIVGSRHTISTFYYTPCLAKGYLKIDE